MFDLFVLIMLMLLLMLLMLSVRRLVSDASKHHAFHLAELSKSISSNPLAILKVYYKDRDNGFPFSFTYTNIPPVVATSGTTTGYSASSSSSSNGRDTEKDSGVSKFDTLEEIEKKIDVESTDETSKDAGSRFWSSIIGGGKASKFKA